MFGRKFLRKFTCDVCKRCNRTESPRRRSRATGVSELMEFSMIRLRSAFTVSQPRASCRSNQKLRGHRLRILDGANCVLIGYGQTGSGKSFTITGLRSNWEHRGLVARLLSDMFAEKSNRRKCSKIRYSVSFVELHGKETRDLLIPEAENRIAINERDPFKEVSIVNVDNEEEALRKIFEGEGRRSIVKGSTYSVSHLATAVITFHVSNDGLLPLLDVSTTAKMHIVEMAGIGTVKRESCRKRAVDIGRANLIKTELERFFSYLAGTESVAYYSAIRSSNLLKILGSTFLISSVIRFVCHVRITKEDLDMTLSALRFAASILRVKPVKVRENVKRRSDMMVQRLRDKVDSLRKELTINDMFLRQEASIHISKSRMEQINRSVLNFLNGKISDFTLFSVSQARALLKALKDLYGRLIAKELQVEKLRETYENFAKEIALRKDSQSSSQKRTRSSSRGLEIKHAAKETGREEVGSLDKSVAGVTFGPYTAAEEEDEREEETDFEETSKPDRHSVAVRHASKIVSQNASMVRRLFERFLKEEREFARTKEKLDKTRKTLAIVRQKFSDLLDNYFQAKRNLDNARDNLSKQQQIQYATKIEDCVNDENEIAPTVETIVDRDITCYQKVLMNLEGEVAQTQNEIRELIEQQCELRAKITSSFREYCKKVDCLLLYNDKFMTTLLESAESESTEIIRNKFYRLQRAMMRKFEDHSTTDTMLT